VFRLPRAGYAFFASYRRKYLILRDISGSPRLR
jgi:hypothetical protein